MSHSEVALNARNLVAQLFDSVADIFQRFLHHAAIFVLRRAQLMTAYSIDIIGTLRCSAGGSWSVAPLPNLTTHSVLMAQLRCLPVSYRMLP
jgi:hypothetical protein